MRKRGLISRLAFKEFCLDNQFGTGRHFYWYEWRFFPRIIWLHPITTAFTVAVLSLAAAAIIAGWADLFSRLGALVVASGVFIEFSVTRRYRAELQEDLYGRLYSDLDDRFSEVIDKTSRSQFAEYPAESSSLLFDNPPGAPEDLVKLESSKSRPFVMLEFGLVILGTTMWAFGDWIVNLLHCGTFECS